MLLQAQEGLSELTGAVKEGFAFLSAAQPPQTPSHRHTRSEGMESSPMRALNAAKTAGKLEKDHLKDAAKVSTFIIYLQNHPAAVISYLALVDPEMDDVRRHFVMACLEEAEKEKEKNAMGI